MAATTTATPTACPNCSSVDLINDQFTNDLMCCSCGALVQENRLVSEVGFTEAGGKKSVVGQTIDWSTMTSGNGVAAGGGRVSRDITMQRARRNIESFAVKLKIPATMQDQANRVFGLAVDKNFNRGRKSMLVAAACLYVVCRNQQSPLLLLDFADASVFSVKEIGRRGLLEYGVFYRGAMLRFVHVLAISVTGSFFRNDSYIMRTYTQRSSKHKSILSGAFSIQ